MDNISWNIFNNSEIGIALIDIILAFSLIFLLAGLSTPSINKFVSSYRLRIAVSDLLSYIYKAKSISAKESAKVTLNFNPGSFSGYILEDSDENVIARVGFDNCHNANIKFIRCYNGNVIYKSPIEGEGPKPERLTIKANGLSSRGFVYLTNKEQRTYYKVGIFSSSGIIGVEKWNGSGWE